MSLKTLLDGVTESGAGSSLATIGLQSRASGMGIVQAVISDTATVKLQGWVKGEWFEIATFSAGGAAVFEVPPFIRGNVTDYTSGSVTLAVEL